MRASLIWTGVATSLIAHAAVAQPGEQANRARAEEIFAAASEAMERGDFAEACPRLEEVVTLQPRGIGARLKLADCYVGMGKLATAHLDYEAAASLATDAGQPERAAGAREKARALKPRLSLLTITVPDEIAELDGLVVSADGAEIPMAQFNLPFPVDGGTHRIMATAPGRAGFKEQIEVGREEDIKDVEVVLPEEGSGRPERPADGGASTAAPGSTGSWWSPLRIGGFATGITGLVFAGVGIGLVAGNQLAACNTTCSITTEVFAGGTLIGVGGAAMVAGVVMMAVAPRAAPANIVVMPWVVPRSAGVAVAGAF